MAEAVVGDPRENVKNPTDRYDRERLRIAQVVSRGRIGAG